MKRKLIAIAPDGSEVSRRTHRSYSHVVVFKRPGLDWEAYSWSSRLDLAEKNVNKVRNWLGRNPEYLEGIAIVPVVNYNLHYVS